MLRKLIKIMVDNYLSMNIIVNISRFIGLRLEAKYICDDKLEPLLRYIEYTHHKGTIAKCKHFVYGKKFSMIILLYIEQKYLCCKLHIIGEVCGKGIKYCDIISQLEMRSNRLLQYQCIYLNGQSWSLKHMFYI